MSPKPITPILFGLDLGAYSMAVAFHEALGVPSHAFGRERLGATSYSKIVIPHIVPELLKPEVALSEIKELALGCTEALLVPCEDWYVRLVSEIRDSLPENVRICMPSAAIIDTASDKAKFYKLLDGFGIDYPRAAVFYSHDELSPAVLDSFSYPAVVKPTDSTEYWRCPFENMKKVYFASEPDEVERISEKIFSSGYGGGVILQEKIGEGAERVAVYTAVCDGASRVVTGVFGEVVLGEPTDTGFGNHLAVITEKKPEICERLDGMLEKTGYIGIANFDLISDGEKWFVLELNPRQGRSSDYTRAAGVNLAEALLKIVRGEKLGVTPKENILWRAVPLGTLFRYSPRRELLARVDRLHIEGREHYAYSYRSDLLANPKRRLYSLLHALRHRERFYLAKRAEKERERGTRSASFERKADKTRGALEGRDEAF